MLHFFRETWKNHISTKSKAMCSKWSHIESNSQPAWVSYQWRSHGLKWSLISVLHSDAFLALYFIRVFLFLYPMISQLQSEREYYIVWVCVWKKYQMMKRLDYGKNTLTEGKSQVQWFVFNSKLFASLGNSVVVVFTFPTLSRLRRTKLSVVSLRPVVFAHDEETTAILLQVRLP